MENGLKTIEWAGELGMEEISYCGKCDYQQPNCACPPRIDRNYGPKGGSFEETAERVMIDNKKVLENLAKTDTGAIKYDQEKPDFSLLSSIAITKVTEVMTFGKKKYSAHNWRAGFKFSRVLAAALRHIFAYLGGESKDPETGFSHLAHAACCLMFLLEFEQTHPELDDRYKAPK